jgi:predicted acetyltransferase
VTTSTTPARSHTGGWTPFLVYSDEHIAGFVLLGIRSVLGWDRDTRSVAEFFTMRKYGRMGIGRKVAFQLFDRFRGAWEVFQTRENLAARAFWAAGIGEYTDGDFEKTDVDSEAWRGPVQTFDNSRRTV